MPLSRTTGDPPLTMPDGVRFCLQNTDEKVHWAITRAALVFLAGHFLLERDYQQIFETYRDAIEDTAALIYDDHGQANTGIIVNAHDLVAYARDLAVSDETPALAH